MEDLEKYRQMGQKIFDKLRLYTYPIAIKILKEGDKIPKEGKLFGVREYFGDWLPLCTLYFWTRHSGVSFKIFSGDISCGPCAFLYYGLEECENHPERVYEGWARYAGYKKDLAAEHSSRATDHTFAPGEIEGILTSPLNKTLIKPDVVLIYCNSVILGHLILAATYEGDCIQSEFNGMESSCKGVTKTYQTHTCNVGCPGYGDRIAGGASDHEFLFFIPENKLEMVANNIFKAGSKEARKTTFGNPEEAGMHGIPHTVVTFGSNRILGQGVINAPQWQYTRRKVVNRKE